MRNVEIWARKYKRVLTNSLLLFTRNLAFTSAFYQDNHYSVNKIMTQTITNYHLIWSIGCSLSCLPNMLRLTSFISPAILLCISLLSQALLSAILDMSILSSFTGLSVIFCSLLFLLVYVLYAILFSLSVS